MIMSIGVYWRTTVYKKLQQGIIKQASSSFYYSICVGFLIEDSTGHCNRKCCSKVLVFRNSTPQACRVHHILVKRCSVDLQYIGTSDKLEFCVHTVDLTSFLAASGDYGFPQV